MSHVPFWFAQFPKSRRSSYPRLRGEHITRVVIVGGGLTGVSCALACAAAGLDPVLLEASVIGGGMTAGDGGLLREGFAGSFEAAVKAHGVRTARDIWDGMRRGSLDFAAALRRYKIRCDLTPQDVLSFARPGEEAGRMLRREYDARRRAGVDGTWVMSAAVARETAIVSAGAIRTRGAVLDPYRACVGMASVAESRGARLYEKSEVTRIRAGKQHVDVQTEGGTVRADFVIVATGAPIQDLRALRRHLRADHTYGIVTAPLPAAMRREVGKRGAVLDDLAGEGRIIRWMDGDRIFVQGGRQDSRPRARARPGDHAADWADDVRTVAAVSRDLRPGAGAVLGRCGLRNRGRPAVRSARTATSRATCSHWDPRGTVRGWRGPPRACCYVMFRGSHSRATRPLDLGASEPLSKYLTAEDAKNAKFLCEEIN